MKQNNIFSSFVDLYNKINSNNSRIPEIVCFILFVTGIIFLSFFHEPWYDELQAWNISMDNLHDILFVTPHYEGHPAFWHLILKIFSSRHFHPEVGLGIVNTTFVSAAVALILFKSPFPKLIRLTLPFTFFIFFQTGVICRPYSVFLFALSLMGTLYKEKNEKPFKFVSVLGLLCLTSAFGMVVAFGVVISWLVEIWNKQNIFVFIKNFLTDKRFFAFLGLFFLCLLLAFEVYPDPSALSPGKLNEYPFLDRILYFSLVQLLDTTFVDFYDYFINPPKTLINIKFIFLCAVGLLFSIAILWQFFKEKKLFFFTCVYSSFITFSFLVCLHKHHLGLLLMILIFCFWVLYDTNKNIKLNFLLKIFLTITLLVQISWTIISFVNEVQCKYAPYREFAMYVKQHNLTNYKILGIEPAGSINAYFGKNIFYCFNALKPQKMHLISKNMSPEEFEETKKICRKKGKPDFVIGEELRLDTFFGENVDLHRDYFTVRGFCGGKIFKNSLTPRCVYLFADKRFFDKMKDYE